MYVEINLAGMALGVGIYGEHLLGIMKQQGVKLTIASDTHNLSQEKGAKTIFEQGIKGEKAVRQTFIDAGFTEIHTL